MQIRENGKKNKFVDFQPVLGSSFVTSIAIGYYQSKHPLRAQEMDKNDAVSQSTEPAILESTGDTESRNSNSQRIGLLKTLWRGEAPLVITYWLFGFVGSLVIYGISTELFNVTSSKLVKLSMLAVIVAYQAFVTVSIWRASKKYKGKRGYAVLAQVAVFFGWFSSIPKIILAVLQVVAG